MIPIFLKSLKYLCPFFITFCFTYLLFPLAKRLGLVDMPGGRKRHQGEIPLIGGITMFIGFSFAILTLDTSMREFRAFFASSLLLIIIGVLDDFRELSARARFVAQIVAALIVTLWGNNVLYDLGNILFMGDIHLSYWGILVTIIAIVGVINAVNMTDGLDGLAATLTLSELSMLSILAKLDHQIVSMHILLIIICVLFAFLIFNFPFPKLRKQAYIFMGDAGSMFLGFTLAWFLVSLSQGAHPAAKPVTMLWIMALPLFDATYVIIDRIRKRQSPFHANHDHLHYVLSQLGFDNLQIVLIISGVSLLLGIGGIMAGIEGVSEGVIFFSFLFLFVIYWILMHIMSKQLFIRIKTCGKEYG